MNTELYKLLQEGKPALLTASQLKLLGEVHAAIESRARRTYKCYDFPGEEKPVCEKTPEITILEEHLGLIIKHLREGRLARQNFTKTYPKWKKNRDKCIARLHEIAKSIDTDRFNCNVSKLVGYCTSAVGGGITLVSAALIPFTLGLTTPLAIGGAALTAAGASTAVGTSITEVVLQNSKVDKAKQLIEKDKNYFESMSDWLNQASDLQDVLSKVMNLDFLKDVIEEIKTFIEDAIKIPKKIDRMIFIEIAVGDIIKNFKPAFKLAIRDISQIISIAVTIVLLLLNIQNRLIFDCASLTIRSILGVGSLVTESVNIFTLSKAFTANAAVAKNFAKAVTRGAVAVVGIALDVVGIVFTSIDIHKGSLSPEAEKIVQAASGLREEADVLEGVYKSLSPETRL